MLQINKILTKKGCIYYCENNEEEAFFMNKIKNETIISKIHLFKSYKRRLEKYTVHFILQQLYPNGYQLIYDEKGKPFLENLSSHHISISHSKNFIAVFIANSSNLGLDVEQVSDKVEKTSSKFMNANEQLLINKPEDYNLIWGAKEAVYKSFDITGIDFKTGMNVLDIDVFNNELKLHLHYKDLNTFCKLQYQLINGFTLVYHE